MSADLRRLREWLTFDQATHDLTRRMGQRMGWPELLQLALDGHAALCVSLPPVEVHAPGAGESHFIVSGARPRPRTIEGLWDLPAEGLARQHLYQILRDNTSGTGPSMAASRAGLVVARGTTRWEIPQRVWRDHVMTGSALAVRWEVLDALVGAQNDLDTRAGASEAALSPATPVPADETWAKTAKGRQARIKEFLQTLKESGVLKDLDRIHPKADERSLGADERLIWEAAGYTDRTVLFAWKTCRTGRRSLAAARKFMTILRMTPSQFLAEWNNIRGNRGATRGS